MEPHDAFALVARAMGLRHERIEPEHQPHPEDHDCGEHTAAHAGRGDRRRSERSDHDGVDEPHAHPPDFCEDDRAGQLHEGAGALSSASEAQCKVGRVRALLTIYLMGVLVGLWRTDGPPATKLTMALLWPIGPLAFVVTVSGLVVAAAIAFVGPGEGSLGA